ncbi:MAG: collagen-binding domain-containing protein [Bacteroidota bacterium]
MRKYSRIKQWVSLLIIVLLLPFIVVAKDDPKAKDTFFCQQITLLKSSLHQNLRTASNNQPAQNSFLTNESSVSPLQSCSIIQNGNFESGNTNGWNRFTSVSTDAHSGNYSGYRADAAQNPFQWRPNSGIIGGESYTLTFWAKKEGGGVLIVGIDWLDGNQTEVGDVEIGSITSGSWTRYTLTAAAPANATGFGLWTFQNSGAFKIDDVCLSSGAVTPPTGSENPTALAEGFNLFIEQNVTLTSGDIEGPVAMGGNCVLTGQMAVAGNNAGTYIAPGDANPTGLLIGGRVNYVGGNGVNVLQSTFVKLGDDAGSNVYDTNNGTQVLTRITAGNYDATPRINLNTNQSAASVLQSNLIDFSDRFATFSDYTQQMRAFSPTGTISISGTSANINLTANQLNVFEITAAQLASINAVYFNIQPNANTPLVINVNAAGSLTWDVPTFAGIGDSQGPFMLLNFHSTTNLTINGPNTIVGTVFAPSADFIKNTSGNVNGQVIAKSFVKNNGELHQHPFAVNLPLNRNGGGSIDSDYGDAPASYGDICYTITLNNNPYSPTRLGNTVDGETSMAHSANANGDGADEDGVILSNSGVWEPGTTQNVTFSWSNNDWDGFVYGWADWNGNGTFDNSEVIINNFRVGSSSGTDNYGGQRAPSGTKTINVNVPSNAACGTTYARFTIQSDENEQGPTGTYCSTNDYSQDGEVEDYQLQITGGSCSSSACIILENGNFETGNTSGWNRFTSVSTDAHSGNYSGYRADATENPFQWRPNSGIVAGRSYTLTFWAKKEGGGELIVGIDWINSNSTEISDISTGDITSSNWAQYTLTGSSPANTTGFGLWTYQTSGAFKIDDVCLSETDGGTTETTDYSDAPASYGSVCYLVDVGDIDLKLGNNIDAEGTALYSNDAMGDDNSGDDEDGVTFVGGTTISAGTVESMTINYTDDKYSSFLSAWIDFNRDGDFNDAGEQILDDYNIINFDGTANYNLIYNVPNSASCGTTFARVILSDDENNGPSGLYCSVEGEVEDYQITIADCSSTGSDVDADITCDDGQEIDLVWEGLKNAVPKTLTIPSGGTVFQTVVEIVYLKNNPGETITVTDNTGTNHVFNRQKIDNEYVYRGTINGNISSVTYTNQTYEDRAQSMMLYVYRNSSAGHLEIAKFTTISGYQNVKTVDFVIPTGAAPRDILVSVPVSEVTLDGRGLKLTASAGGVSYSTVEYWNNLPNGCCIDVVDLPLNNVPANASVVTLEIDSRHSSIPSQNAQSYVIAGTVALEIECSCPSFSALINGPSSGCTGSPVTFSAPDVTELQGETYVWNFGAGANPATATGQGPHSITYASSGKKSVTLQVSNQVCDGSASTTVSIHGNITNGGTIAGNESNCGSFDPSNITSAAAPTGSGTFTYSWQRRTDPENDGTYTGWTTIGGATGATYNPSTISVTTQYRRRAEGGNCSGWVNSNNVVTKTVFNDGTDLVVNSAGDTNDANPGDGTCSDSDCVCTLRAAIQEANARAGADVITFNIPTNDPRFFNPSGNATSGDEYFNIQLTLGDLPTVTEDLVIDGLTQPNAACNANFVNLHPSIGGQKPQGLMVLVNANQITGRTTYWRSTVDRLVLKGIIMINYTTANIGGTYGLDPQNNVAGLEMDCSIICTGN